MGRIDQINQQNGFPELVRNVPPNYPTTPNPGKISLLWKFNNQNLWHRFSPFTDGDNVFGIFPNKQPFVYRYPDEVGKSFFDRLPTHVKTLASEGNITAGTVDDVVRVSKFTVSPVGILYNAKQGLLQRLNPFDETRVYNPLSPILATISGMTFGVGQRPIRHIEGEGVAALGLSVASSITSTVGISFPGSNAAPKSTVGDLALPDGNIGQGKGLIRGTDAGKAIASLKSKWQVSAGAAPSGLAGFVSMVDNAAKSLFGGAPKSEGQYRADEQAYILMVSNTYKFKSYNIFGVEQSVMPRWVAKTKPYEINVTSEVESKFDTYADKRYKAPSKFNDPIAEETIRLATELKKSLLSLQKNPLYDVATNTYSKLLASGDAVGFDNAFKDVNASKLRSEKGVSNDYRESRFTGPRPVDKTFVLSNRNLKMAASFTSDGLNQLGVLNKNKKFNTTEPGSLQFPSLAKSYPGWTEYKPYDDDLIAFFFYDVVNSKYIPFRATVKGLSEGNTAYWDELRFIGRADQLYSYNGFSRTLGFTFNVVIGSVTELLPTWQKINYLASSVKPSNYTSGDKVSGNVNKFIVPPMFMVTIGDLYKFQPIVISSVNINIPDDAVWETLNENNSNRWSYLTNVISSPTVGKMYGQLPREIEIAVTCNLLEKERAIVGGSHFGHAPRKDDWEELPFADMFVNSNGKEFLPPVTQLHEKTLVLNNSTPTPVLLDAGAPFDATVENVKNLA
jgi:hypothetical protein